MAHFYGVIQGNRGEATRMGTKDSGFYAVAASWAGAVRVNLYVNNGVDWAQVTLGEWHGAGQSPPRVLYDGPVSGEEEA